MTAGEIVLDLIFEEERADEERMEDVTINLFHLLKQLDITSIQRAAAANQAPAGTRGDPVTIGHIVLGIGVTAVPALIAFIQHWVGERRRVKLIAPNGASIEIPLEKSYTAEELIMLVEKLNNIGSQ